MRRAAFICRIYYGVRAARYWFYGITARAAGAIFPWGTLLVNVLGCTFIGFFATLTGPDGRLLVRPGTRQFVMAGFCGGFTTFSTFSLETLNLARDGEWGPALETCWDRSCCAWRESGSDMR